MGCIRGIRSNCNAEPSTLGFGRAVLYAQLISSIAGEANRRPHLVSGARGCILRSAGKQSIACNAGSDKKTTIHLCLATPQCLGAVAADASGDLISKSNGRCCTDAFCKSRRAIQDLRGFDGEELKGFVAWDYKHLHE